MKAAFVTTNLKGGGAEKAVLKVASGLAARGHDVHVVLLEQLLEHAPLDGVTLHALTAPGRAASKGWLGKRAAAWRLRGLFRRLAQGAPFDLVVSTLPYCDEVVALAGLPRVWFRIANTLSMEVGLLGRNDRAKAQRRFARYVRLYDGSNLLAVSDGVARDLVEKLGISRANIVRIYNPIDVAAIRVLAARPEAALPRDPYVVHVGRFAPQKRHDLLFEALRRSGLSHRLVLLANASPALARLIAEKGVSGHVIVAGFQSNPYPWIAGAELLVLCSDHEGMPNVLVEALACGTRVASTDCPSGPREVLEGDLARHLVPCGDAEALARAMRAALGAPRPAAPRSLERFAPQSVLPQYEALPGLWRGG
jgi:glycosyltransferase involved in cell wall biosynthesis